MMRLLPWLLVPLSASCASNQFSETYQGSIYPETPYATTISAPPPNAREIGRSEFMSTRTESAADAVDAAKSVGADYVHWGGEFSQTTREVDYRRVSVPVQHTSLYYYGGPYGGGDYAYGTHYGWATSYQPYAYNVNWYRYSAVYYRSWALDPAPRP